MMLSMGAFITVSRTVHPAHHPSQICTSFFTSGASPRTSEKQRVTGGKQSGERKIRPPEGVSSHGAASRATCAQFGPWPVAWCAHVTRRLQRRFVLPRLKMQELGKLQRNNQGAFGSMIGEGREHAFPVNRFLVHRSLFFYRHVTKRYKTVNVAIVEV